MQKVIFVVDKAASSFSVLYYMNGVANAVYDKKHRRLPAEAWLMPERLGIKHSFTLKTLHLLM